MLKAAASYQHFDPEIVGNEMRVVVSELAGRSNILHLAERQGIEIASERAREVLDEVKALEHSGASFEGAEASVELMLQRKDPGYRPPFELSPLRLMSEEGVEKIHAATMQILEGVGHNDILMAPDNGYFKCLSAFFDKVFK